MTQLAIHKLVPEEKNYVLATWLKSYVIGEADFLRHLDRSVYWSHHPRLIEAILERSEVIVAHPTSEPSVVAGWMCYEGKTIHYMYVRSSLRRFGVATQLLKESGLDLELDPVFMSHRTKLCNELVGYWYGKKFYAGKFSKIVFNPYQL